MSKFAVSEVKNQDMLPIPTENLKLDNNNTL